MATRATAIVVLLLAAALVTTSQARGQQDSNRITAEKITKEADQLRAATDGESQRKAAAKLEEAVLLWQTAGDRAEEAAALYKIGLIYRALGDNSRAIEHLERVLPLHRALNNNQGVVDTLGLLGDIVQTFGETQKAVDAYREALALAKRAGYQQGEGRTLTRLSLLFTSIGDYQNAIEANTQALPIARAARDRLGEASVLLNAGLAQQLSGDNQTALESYRQSLPLFRDLAERGAEPANLNRIRAGEANALQNIGAVYGVLGDKQTALQWYAQALSLYRTGGNRQLEASTLNNMGSAYLALGENPKASESYNQALQLARETKDRTTEARALHNLADLSSRMSEKRQALDFAAQALSIFGRVGDRRAEATVDVQIGSIYYELGEPAKALEAYNDALSITRTVKDPAGEARSLAGLARIDRDGGSLDAARKQQEAALSLIESIRGSVAIHELRASYFASTQPEYEFYIDLLMRLHKLRPSDGFDAMAFHASERARARSLLELLAEGQAGVRQGVDPALLEREHFLRLRLNATSERYARMFGNPNTKTQAGALLRQVDTQTAELEELEGQIRSTSPHYAALMQPQPLSVREVQGQVLDSDTLLLEYSLGVERSFVWVVTKTSLTAHELPPRSVVEAAAQRVYDLLTARQAPLSRTRLAEADAQYASEAAALSRMVLSPVWSQLGTKRRLLIVGDGRLQYVPFAALPEPARENAEPIPLVVEHEVVSMPSASTIGVLRREISNRAPSPKAVAIFADPVFARDDARVRPSAGLAVTDSRGGMARLLFSRREAAAILAVAPAGQSTQALDFQANRAMVTDAALRQYRIIHFATHGILDSEHPELSGIVLSLVDREGKPQDGFLRLHDFYNMNLPAELVVLSACQTALGKDVKGEGLVGLTRGFMYAGAARVVASLWKVDDAATAELMKRFYQGMLGNQQLSPAAALRAAQLAMLQQKQWASPYYWAAFVHQGEWNTWEKAGN